MLTTDFRTASRPRDRRGPRRPPRAALVLARPRVPAHVARERIAARAPQRARAGAPRPELQPDVVNWWAMGGMSLSLIERVRRAGLPAVGVVGDDWMDYGPRVDGWQRLLRRPGPAGRPGGASSACRPARPARRHLAVHQRRHARRRDGRARLRAAEPRSPTPAWTTRCSHAGAGARLALAAAVRRPHSTSARASTPRSRRWPTCPRRRTLTVLGVGRRRATCAELRGLRRAARRRGPGPLRARSPRGELPAAYAAADALLFPVRWEEPWGLVPLEAMAVGTPGGGHRHRRLARVPARRRERAGGGPRGRAPRDLAARGRPRWPPTRACARASAGTGWPRAAALHRAWPTTRPSRWRCARP